MITTLEQHHPIEFAILRLLLGAPRRSVYQQKIFGSSSSPGAGWGKPAHKDCWTTVCVYYQGEQWWFDEGNLETPTRVMLFDEILRIVATPGWRKEHGFAPLSPELEALYAAPVTRRKNKETGCPE